MIIDFHTHTFPEKIAQKALEKLSGDEGLTPFTDATDKGLLASMKKASIDISILLPVATNPAQTEGINERALAVNSSLEEHRCFGASFGSSAGYGTDSDLQSEDASAAPHTPALLSFGGIHPDNTDYKRILSDLAAHHVKGIKLHPVFQHTDMDDDRMLRMIDFACSLGLIVSIHGGYDISDAFAEYANPQKTLSMLKTLRPEKILLAHMGCWREWDQTEALLGEISTMGLSDFYVDTSFVPSPVPITKEPAFYYDTTIPAPSDARFVSMVRTIGADRVLFGTDSPWTDQRQSVDAILRCDFSEMEKWQILGENARRLLGL